VIVSKVIPKGFLDAAQIKPMDVILSINKVEFDRHGIVIGKEGMYRHKNIFDVIKLVPIGESTEIVYSRAGVIHKAKAIAMRNPKKGITSIPILNDRIYLDLFGMIVQPLSFEIIQAIQEVDPTAQLDMLQTIDQEKPELVVTHIYQGTQADQMEWPIGELIIKANNRRIHTLDQLKKEVNKHVCGAVLLECRSGRIGYFQVTERVKT